jgi:SAM-dependent methyltransferase
MADAPAIGTVRVQVDVALAPQATFDAAVDELRLALARDRLHLDARADGRVVAGGRDVGRVTSWQPGALVEFEWQPASWSPELKTTVRLTCEPIEGGTRVALEQRGWDRALGDAGIDLVGWFAGAVAGPLLRASTPAALGDWMTDRRARRPEGAPSRGVYRDPLYHRPLFKVIVSALAAAPGDHFLEVGCGGGAMMTDVLAGGCRAAGIDHSADMLRTTRDANRAAAAQGRLALVRATAERLPFVDRVFTCAAMSGVFGFLSDPVAALREMHRVLRPGGRIVVLGSDPSMRGTPAAPEPMASRLHFYEDDELAQLARDAGFADARVERRRLYEFAREAGVPEEHLPLFDGPGAPFLFATRSSASTTIESR